MTPEQLEAATGCGAVAAQAWSVILDQVMAEFEINSRYRKAAFLAQVAHESGRFRYTRELWGPTPAQKGYEGRADLGNTEVGDGYRFRGRGLIQVTGRANYALVEHDLCVPLLDHPERLEEPTMAARSAGWFWKKHGLNELADLQLFTAITKRINGGVNGLTERTQIYHQALDVLT